jgi:hypothetical protein
VNVLNELWRNKGDEGFGLPPRPSSAEHFRWGPTLGDYGRPDDANPQASVLGKYRIPLLLEPLDFNCPGGAQLSVVMG